MSQSLKRIDILPVSAFTDNYIWLIIDNSTRQVVCIDPGAAEPVLDYIQKHQLRLTTLLITHHHYDHINGINLLCQNVPDLKVYAPNDLRIPKVTDLVTDERFIDIDGYRFEILATPGHTKTHLCYYEVNHRWLFCGDTLFSAGCGRVFEGTYEQLYASLERLKKLPDETKVFCGHEYTLKNLRFAKSIEPQNRDIQQYLKNLEHKTSFCSLPSTMGLEKKINPFLRVEFSTVRKYVEDKYFSESSGVAVFKALRIEKDNF